MGIPYEDTPMGVFESSMSDVQTAAGQIIAALNAAKNLVGDQTWVGNPATAWNSDFMSRYTQLTNLLNSIQPGGDEYKALYAKAQQDQATFVKNEHHAGP